jgi:hypothetical protein
MLLCPSFTLLSCPCFFIFTIIVSFLHTIVVFVFFFHIASMSMFFLCITLKQPTFLTMCHHFL